MRYITLVIAFLICTAAESQVIRAEPFYTAPEEAAAPYAYLLDTFTGAVVGYSLRKLDGQYTGSAIRVRRKSDNTEQDIGFVNNYIDTASLKTFVGIGVTDTAWVVTWYNQADSSGVFGVKNLTQTNAVNQPLILVSGALSRGADGDIGLYAAGAQRMSIANSTASMKFLHDGTKNDVFSAAQFGITSNPDNVYGLYGTASSSGSIGDALRYDDRSSVPLDNSMTKVTLRGIFASFTIDANTQNIITPNDIVLVNSNSDPANATVANRHSLYINGGSALKANGANNSPTSSNASFNFEIMTNGNNVFPMTGYVHELIIYNSDMT